MIQHGPRSRAEGPVETEHVLSETRRVFRRSGSLPCRGHSPALRSILCPTGSGTECAGCGCTIPTARRRRRLLWKRLSPSPEPPPPAQDAATAPTENVEPTGEAVEAPEQADEAVEHAEQPEPMGSGMILVSRQPVAVLASPSASAPTMYGFPAGRPFRVIGHDGGFAHIQDLKSSASGWIDEAALAPPPRVPTASAPSQTEPFAVSRNPTNPSADLKPKATKNDNTGTANSEAATQPDRRRSWLIWSRGCLRGYLRQR